MNLLQARKRYIPMTETMFFILDALREERHGYGIMQYVAMLTSSRITLGAGTIYSSISKLEKDGLIVQTREENRQKKYLITEEGKTILEEDAHRILELAAVAESILKV